MLRRAAASLSSRVVPASSKTLHHLLSYRHQHQEKVGASSETRLFISFVLGGPGSGKGTQCTKIAETFGFVHLSAGDLLRKEISSDGEMGAIICDIIKEGKIVPSKITVNLIRRAIESSENNKFLIDGFPRCDENRIAFERIVGMQPDFVLYFDCPEEDMVKRVLTRNQGRIDDNIETVKKRLTTFDELNLPVIKYYSGKGIVHKVNAVGTVEEVFDRVRPLFAAFKGELRDSWEMQLPNLMNNLFDFVLIKTRGKDFERFWAPIKFLTPRDDHMSMITGTMRLVIHNSKGILQIPG